MKKRKIIILGIIGVGILIGSIVIPIIVISNNNDEEDKKDVKEIIKLLKNKSISKRTIEIDDESIGKIIANNKDKIIAKIKKLIGDSNLRGVSINISMTTDVDISIFKRSIIVEIKKGKYSQKLEGTSGLSVKKSLSSQEIKINKIKTHFETLSNLNLILPQAVYDTDNVILEAIKVKLVNDIETISSSDSHLVVKKVGSSVVTSVATHGETSTQYVITVGEHDFNLNLNQEEFSSNEKEKIETIKTHLETSGNLNLILPKTTYNTDNDVLQAIKVKLINDVETISSSDSHLIVKKVGSSAVTSVATHGETSTQYVITVGEHDFTLNLNQEEFSSNEKEKIETIKTHLETSGNLNLMLPQAVYDADNVILEAIKVKLVNDIETISSSDSHLVVKKVGSSAVTLVATHGETPTQYEISIGEHDFTLNLNQEEFSSNEKEKIETIKTHLETSGNLNLMLPQAIYDTDNVILEAIKVKLVNDIETISSSDSHLIVKKVGSSVVTSVAIHGETSTQYVITVGEHDFNLNLNQEEFSSNEKEKIETIKTHLETSGNLNLMLPQVVYDADNVILEAIKVKLVNNIETISSSDSHLIVKKVGSSAVTLVATHGQTPTQYEISVGEHDFTLNLNQEEFSSNEKEKIETIKTHLETLGNLNLILPKTTYDIDNVILEAIKVKLVNDIETISSGDSHLIVKKVGSSAVTLVATHGETPTQYEISIGEHDFTLNLNQEEFSSNEKEKIEIIKTYLETIGNSDLVIKNHVYDTDEKILIGIREKLVLEISNFENEYSHLIVKKVGSSAVTSVATHGETSTQYVITVGEHDFNLNLNQDQFTESYKIRVVKKYLKSNLKIELPKDITGSSYNTDSKILTSIRQIIFNSIIRINFDDIEHFISREESSSPITSVATYDQPSTSYEIVFFGTTFRFELNQSQYSDEEKIDKIKTHLETSDNLNLILPKDTGSDYNEDVKILIEIIKKIVDVIPEINMGDSHLITKKLDSSAIKLVAAHGQTPTQYEITIDGKDFTLNLNQANTFTRIQKIESVEKFFETNPKIELPKDVTGFDYDERENVLLAIKKVVVDSIPIVSEEDYDNLNLEFNFDISKENRKSSRNNYNDRSILRPRIILVQEEYSIQEKAKVSKILNYIVNIKDFEFVLPRDTTGSDYDSNIKIFRAIKKIIVNAIPEISDQDFDYFVKKSDLNIAISSIPLNTQEDAEGAIYIITIRKKRTSLIDHPILIKQDS